MDAEKINQQLSTEPLILIRIKHNIFSGKTLFFVLFVSNPRTETSSNSYHFFLFFFQIFKYMLDGMDIAYS